MPALGGETLAIAALLRSLEVMPAPIRAPSHTLPDYWSKPLNQTLIQPVPAGTPWTDILVAETHLGYALTLNRYFAGAQSPAAIAGLEFRFRRDNSPVELITIDPTAEVFRDGAGVYPMVYRDVFFWVPDNQVVALQVRNPTAFQRTAFCALRGWYMQQRDSSNYTDVAGMTDNIREGGG